MVSASSRIEAYAARLVRTRSRTSAYFPSSSVGQGRDVDLGLDVATRAVGSDCGRDGVRGHGREATGAGAVGLPSCVGLEIAYAGYGRAKKFGVIQ